MSAAAVRNSSIIFLMLRKKRGETEGVIFDMMLRSNVRYSSIALAAMSTSAKAGFPGPL